VTDQKTFKTWQSRLKFGRIIFNKLQRSTDVYVYYNPRVFQLNDARILRSLRASVGR